MKWHFVSTKTILWYGTNVQYVSNEDRGVNSSGKLTFKWREMIIFA